MGKLASVVLAVPGEMVAADDEITHYDNKVGGAPRFPDAVYPYRGKTMTCQVCGEPMVLVVQAYAPLAEDQAGTPLDDRTLYLYACIKPGCGKLPGSWRALRAQLTRTFERGPPQTPNPAPDARHPVACSMGDSGGANNFVDFGTDEQQSVRSSGAEDCAYQDSGNGCVTALRNRDTCDGSASNSSYKAPQEGEFDFSDLNTALDGLTDGHTSSIKDGREKGKPVESNATGLKSSAIEMTSAACCGEGSLAFNSQPDSGLNPQPTPANDSFKLALPEFFLVAVPEPAADNRGVCTMSVAESAHVEKLLAAYEAETQKSGGESYQENRTEGSWAGEAYEKGSDNWSDGGAFWRFRKCISQRPEQCARYSWKGQLLNPCKTDQEVPNCSNCGSHRSFEFQVMPGVFTAISEAADWCESSAKEAMLASQATQTWEWLTVAVYTCDQSCGDGGRLACIEEVAHVLNEE